MKFGNSVHGLGDTLLLTSICKYFPNEFTVQIPHEKSKFSILFEHLAKVELCTQSEIRPLLEIGIGHYSTRKLRGFFGSVANSMDNRPLVLYSDYKSEKWAHEFLKDKPNPIVFAPNCSTTANETRNIPDKSVSNILDAFKKNGQTAIICQMSSNYRKIDGIELVDIDLRNYIALLRQVGFYAGANTGDEHLATAVGCKTFVYQPVNNDKFKSYEWNYNHPNSLYYNWTT